MDAGAWATASIGILSRHVRAVVEADLLLTWGTPIDFPTWEDKVAAMLSDPERFGHLWAEIKDEADGNVWTINREIDHWLAAHPGHR